MKPREFWIDRHPQSIDEDKLTHVVHFEPNLTGPMELEQLHVREVIEISKERDAYREALEWIAEETGTPYARVANEVLTKYK